MVARCLPAILALLVMGGCSALESPQSETQMRAEMAKLPRDKPGRYAMHFEVSSFSMKGIPADRTQSVRREIEGRGRLGHILCLSAADLNADRYQMLRQFDGANCQINHFTSDGTNLKTSLKCRYDNGIVTDVTMSAVGTGEVQPFEFEVSGTAKGHPEFAMSYAGKGIYEHTGACPAQ
jgi:Protein of unknown function (DUF3617)